MRDFLHEYIKQLLGANTDDDGGDDETSAARQSRIAARQALADYRMLDDVVCRQNDVLPAAIELRNEHAVSLWNLAFEATRHK